MDGFKAWDTFATFCARKRRDGGTCSANIDVQEVRHLQNTRQRKRAQILQQRGQKCF